MRKLRSLVVLIGLFLGLAAGAARAAEEPYSSNAQERHGLAGLTLQQFSALAGTIWQQVAWKCSFAGDAAPDSGTPPSEDPAGSSTDTAWQIDPWG